MFSKRNIKSIFSVLWMMAFMLSFVQPVYAAPVTGSQTAAPAMLQFTSGGHVLGFSSSGMLAVTGEHALRVDFVGAHGVQPQSDGAASQGQTITLSRVTYQNLWDGINLDYSTTVGSVYTTTYTLAPGANPAEIRLHYNTALSLNSDGTLNIGLKNGGLSESAPIAWQEIDGRHVPVAVSFRLEGQEVGFSLGNYDPAYILTIDPSLIWNAFLGNGYDDGNAIAIDGSGNIYVTGNSQGTWGSPLRAFQGGFDAFVAKFSPSGALTWNTFLGGTGMDVGNGISVDGSGNIYVIGRSDATWGSPVRAFAGISNAFAAKLSSSGVVTWNTFLGTSFSSFETGNGITVDGSGNVYVIGRSDVTWGSPVRAYSGNDDAFVAKLNSSGAVTWNTFLGGSESDTGTGIAVDGSGNVYLIGMSDGVWGAPVRAFTNGSSDAFVAKLNSSGALSWNTFLGGDKEDEGSGIAVDGSGNVYMSGYSHTTWGTPLRAYTGGDDGMVAKLNSSGTVVWNTFVGGDGVDRATGIALDGNGNVYVSGKSEATWGSPQRAFGGGVSDAFAAYLNPSGALQANTFLGGSFTDEGQGIAADNSGVVAVTGWSSGTWGTPTRAFSGLENGFLAKLKFTIPTVVSSIRVNAIPSSEASVNYTVTFSNVVTGVDKTDFSLATTGITGASVSSVSGSGKTYTVAVATGSGSGTLKLNVIDNDSIIDGGGTPLGGSGTGNGNFTSGETYTITKTAPGAATLVSPLTTTTLAKPTFVWSKVSAATLYRLWIKNSSGTWVVQNLYSGTNICGATNCAVTITTPLVNGTYTWNIQTLTASQNGAWSGHGFTVAIPAPGLSTLVSPKGTIHLAKPTFIWSKDPVATLYRLWVKDSGGTWVFQNLYAGTNICGVTNCAMVSPSTLANGSYTWYIQTLTNTQNGQWSAQAFVVSVPDVVPVPSGSDTGVK